MDYSIETQQLIDRQCANVEREDFELNKEQGLECLMKTYDLFNLPRPKNVKWVVDIFDNDFERSAGSARSARSARSAGSAWSAWSAGSAGSAGSTGSTGSTGSARSAGSAGSAWSARSARSAGSARSWTALDYDFDWYVFEFEYCQNPDKEYPPNENDKKYLEYCELLMQAKEAGVGYWVEWEDILYLAPTPLVKIDNQNRFHSETKPAIRWKGGKEFYYLAGINFEESLWGKVVSGQMSFKEILDIKNTEQRLQAMKYNSNALMKLDPKLIHRTDRDNELYCIEKQEINKIYDEPKVWLLRFRDPSKLPPNNWMLEEVDPKLAEVSPDADVIQAYHCGLSYEEYQSLRIET